MQIPENTFSDVEQGNTRNLVCDITNSRGGALLTNNFIHFEKETQLLTIVASEENVEKSTLRMTARDINDGIASQNLIIEFAKDTEEANHVIKNASETIKQRV